ncbi:MAG: GNAT family N-acetyltransferase [Chlamydiales bacterium]|nr:GNAT family N-acetyltransferase [Chlamydiales bacterium]
MRVVPYDSRWREQFEVVKAHLLGELKKNCIAVHHVGSTSVPGLCAKPKLDIVVEVKCPVTALKGFEYRGEFNIPLHYGFRAHTPYDVNLHLYEEGDAEIELNLTFRDYLRAHPQVRDAYAQLKKELTQNPNIFEKENSMFTRYNLGKDAFIRDVLNKAGYNRLRMVRCVHHIEKKEAERFQSHFDDNEHFVLCLGTKVIGYAHIEKNKIWMLTVDKKYDGKGYEKEFLKWIEKWLKRHGLGSALFCQLPEEL